MPLLEAARWAVAGLFAGSLLVAAYSDIRYRKIPNWTVVALLVAFVAWIFVGPSVSLPGALAAFGIALVVSFAFYALNVLGAGDSKLFAAVALFAGLKLLAYFALATVLIGGVIALVMIVLNPRLIMWRLSLTGRDDKLNIPYGVPIALAGLLIMFTPPLGAIHDNSPKAVLQDGQLLH
jgi:prepilin peptidase CpaA